MTVALKLDRASSSKPQNQTLLQIGVAWLKRLWWHTKAFVPILGIAFLALGSLVFLQVHWLFRKRVKPLTKAKSSVQERIQTL